MAMEDRGAHLWYVKASIAPESIEDLLDEIDGDFLRVIHHAVFSKPLIGVA